MKRLLIAYDGSPCAEAALEDLAQAGLGDELEAVVVSVADVWLPANAAGADTQLPAPYSEAVRKAREQAQSALRSAQALAERTAQRVRELHPKWKTSGYACADSPAWGILAKAAEWKAELIMVGSHGRSTLERLFLGSVSQKVVAEAVCSTRVARPRKPTHHARLRSIVAVDGSPDSVEAVGAVARRCWPSMSEFRAIAVMDPRLETAIAWPDVYGADWVQERDHEARESIGRMLERAAKILDDAGLTVETHVLNGDPKHELLKHAEAWEADSIFLGARGRQHGGRLALGTMASAVAARAHCSVEIVRV